MPHRRHNGIAGYAGQPRADRNATGKAERNERRRHQKAAAHANKAGDNAYGKAEEQEQGGGHLEAHFIEADHHSASSATESCSSMKCAI